MPDRTLRVRISAVGADSVRRAVRGIQASAQQAARSQQSAEQGTTREAQRGARARQRAAEQGARAATRATQQSARAQQTAERQLQRERDRLARDDQRNANEVFRTRMRLYRAEQQAQQRASQQQERQQRRQRDARGRTIERVGAGVALGAVGTAITAATSTLSAITARLESVAAAVGSRAGVQDIGARTASAQDFELAMVRSSGEFFQGQDAGQRETSRQGLTTEISGIAGRTGLNPMELLNSLTIGQQEFSSFDYFRTNLESIAEEAQRTGASIEDTTRFLGVLRHQLGDSAPSANSTFDIMAAQGVMGSLTPDQLANEFGGQLGQFAAATGTTGEDTLRQFGALANAVKSNDVSPAEAATEMHALMTSFGDSQVRDRLRLATGGHRVGHGASSHIEGGTQGFRADGTVDLQTLINDMSGVQGIGTTDVVFHRSEARLAAGRLAALHNSDRGTGDEVYTFDELMGATAETGHALRAGGISDVMGTSAIASQKIANAGVIEGIQNRAGRVGGANQLLAFNEATIQTGNQDIYGEGGALSHLPFGDFIRAAILPSLAESAAQLSPEMRDMMGSQRTRMGLTLATGGAGGFLSDALGAVGTLGNIGASSNTIQKQAQAPMQIAPDQRVELGDRTIASLRAGQGPTPSPLAPPPSGLRVPRERRGT